MRKEDPERESFSTSGLLPDLHLISFPRPSNQDLLLDIIMTLPPSIHRQFLVSLAISLPVIALLVVAATYLENELTKPEPSTIDIVAKEGLPSSNFIANDDAEPINDVPPSDPSGHEEVPDDLENSSFLSSQKECRMDDEAPSGMIDAIHRGSFSTARHLALQLQNYFPECESLVAKLFVQHADAFLATGDSLLRLEYSDERPPPVMDEEDCWNPHAAGEEVDLQYASEVVLGKWDLCCSQLISTEATGDGDRVEEECFNNGHRICCGLYEGTLSHLRLPALQELSLFLGLMAEQPYGIILEQDGFLRKFDPSAVLWPTGYMLSICLANPENCGIPEVLEAAKSHTRDSIVAVELGAGVGGPSIVLSKLLEQHGLKSEVLATDRTLQALALTAINSQAARAAVTVKHVEDHSNLSQLEELGGYSIVLGSSLQSLFDWQTHNPGHPLWRVLDKLLDRDNPRAIAVLAHVNGAVNPSTEREGKFELVRSISGNAFEMFTRAGDDSDFTISVYRRKLETVEMVDNKPIVDL